MLAVILKSLVLSKYRFHQLMIGLYIYFHQTELEEKSNAKEVLSYIPQYEQTRRLKNKTSYPAGISILKSK